LEADVKEIPLTQGKVALVDDEDYERVAQYKWTLHKPNENNLYAKAKIDGRSVSLHCFLLGVSGSAIVDHKDGNGLDCRRDNMRTCSHAENMQNRRKQINSAAPYKGITLDRRNNVWRAQIQCNHKKMHLGGFATPEEAARAYDNKARELFGEFARTNFAK